MKTLVIHEDLKKRLKLAAANGSIVANDVLKAANGKTTEANAVDAAKDILFSLDPRLRKQDLYMFCSQDFADKYNEAYSLTHAGLVYNTKYDQMTVEGSNNRLHIIPLYNKMGSKFIHICSKSNMLVGYDQMSDAEQVMVKDYEPFILSYIATMFFGVQFESIDKRRLYFIGKSGKVDKINLVLDFKATNKTLKLWSFLTQVIESTYLADNHSKVILIRSESGQTVSIITSQNLTRGNRMESAVVTTDPSVFSVFLADMEDLIQNHSVPLTELFQEKIYNAEHPFDNSTDDDAAS